MSARPLTDPFELRSALSRRAPWEVSREEMAAEVDAELARRRTAYPADVQRDRMTREEADRHLAVWSAIVDDHARHATRIKHLMAGGDYRTIVLEPASRRTWAARVREVRRELALRRNTYPRRVASPTHPLDAEIAAAKLEALDGVHWRYWMELWCFAVPGVDPATDMARHRHVAERAVMRLMPSWEALSDAFGDHVARRAHRTWHDIIAVAGHVSEGGTVGEASDHAARTRLLAVVDAAYHQALLGGWAPDERQAIVAQLSPLLAWITREVIRAAPIIASEPERMAA